MIRYSGLDRRGHGRCGSSLESPDTLIMRLYTAGWRSAVATANGRVVGEISRRPDQPRYRTWWAEGDQR